METAVKGEAKARFYSVTAEVSLTVVAFDEKEATEKAEDALFRNSDIETVNIDSISEGE